MVALAVATEERDVKGGGRVGPAGNRPAPKDRQHCMSPSSSLRRLLEPNGWIIDAETWRDELIVVGTAEYTQRTVCGVCERRDSVLDDWIYRLLYVFCVSVGRVLVAVER
jgi:hypothetical protein